MRNRLSRALALMMALLICVSLLPPVPARAASSVSIKTAGDLIKLAGDCTADSYSEGITVALEADIDLSGADFTGIPIFCGVFEGRGHTISGLVIDAKGSSMGFFRYLTETAQIRNLTLSGEISPSGSKCAVGMLAGENSGLIEGCAVSGSVTGAELVGALVGINTPTGIISSCESEATVRGTQQTGGIAGKNEGLIKSCRFSGSLNCHNLESFTDAGGIAGRNTGIIDGCVNSGAIGHRHNGYNVGGIAGFQKGMVSGCENTGSVLGRKDVGGIAGQLEPSIDMLYGDSMLELIGGEISSLSGIIRQLAGYLSDSAAGTAGDIKQLLEYAQELGDLLEASIGDESENLVELVSDSLKQIDAITGSMDGLFEQIEGLSKTATGEIDGIITELGRLRGILYSAYSTGDAQLSAALKKLEAELDSIELEINNIKAELQAMETAAQNIDGFVTRAAEILADDGLSPVEKMTALADAYKNAGDMDVSGPAKRIADSAANIAAHGGNISGIVSDALDGLSAVLGGSLHELNSALDRLNAHAGALNSAVGGFTVKASQKLSVINTAVNSLSHIIGDYIKAADERYENASGEISDKLDDINAGVAELVDRLAGAGEETGRMANSLMNQIDSLGKVISETSAPEYSVDDISGEEGEALSNGAIAGCRNSGDIVGDINAGGIVGMMSYELLDDPEEDFFLSDKLLVDTTALIRASIRSCRNSGSVSVKNDCAGGIVGRGDLGAILSCVSIADVSSESGGYVGGIAGRISGSISGSHAQGALSGGDYIGGVAGLGTNISGCYTLVDIASEGEKLGAIAGAMPEGKCSGNYFINEGRGGIDGISYSGRAFGLDYSDFVKLEGLPQEFLEFGVSFVADGKTIAAFRLGYGESFDTSLTPACPEKEGYLGGWEDFDPGSIKRSLVIKAQYVSWRTAISSGGERPIMLAEGSFSDKAGISIKSFSPEELELPEGSSCASAYDYELTDAGAALPDEITFRILADEKASSLALLREDGELIPVSSRRDGSYLVFEAPAQGRLLILEESASYSLIIILSAAGLLLILILILIVRRRKKGGGSKPPEEKAPTQEEEERELERV